MSVRAAAGRAWRGGRRRLRRLLGGGDGVTPSGLAPAQRLDERADLREFPIGRFTRGHLTVSNRSPGSTLEIGQFCSFAHGTHILLGGEHRSDYVTTYRFSSYPEFRTWSVPGEAASDQTATSKGGVRIGNDVWIGTQALVLSGVTIGDGAIIGAGSVVRQDVPAYGIVAGNPGRVAGFRFPPEQIAALERIAWWDWPLDRIEAQLPLLLSGDVAGFIAAHDPGPAA